MTDDQFGRDDESSSSNGTREGFINVLQCNEVDLDNDGFVKPSEFDSSHLIILIDSIYVVCSLIRPFID